jgi:hypothetical protein
MILKLFASEPFNQNRNQLADSTSLKKNNSIIFLILSSFSLLIILWSSVFTRIHFEKKNIDNSTFQEITIVERFFEELSAWLNIHLKYV